MDGEGESNPQESCANVGCTTASTGKLLLCARCESVKYCSVECQKQAWELHRATCNEKIPSQPTELLPYTLVYYVVDQISHIRVSNKDSIRTAEICTWVIDFLQYQFGLPIAGQWKRPKRVPLLRELPPKATWPASEEIQQLLTNEAKERIKDGLLRRDIKTTLHAGKNVSTRNPWSELHTMMRVEGEIMGRERQRNMVLETQWPTYKEGTWMESPLALVKDLEPDNFECDACLRYSEYVVLASSYKDQQRYQEALPWALQSLALLEPWDQQFELPLESRTDNYGVKFWDDERENLLQCMTITHCLICQIYGQLHQFDHAEEHGIQAINYAQLMESDQQTERLYAAYLSLSTIPSVPFLAKLRGEMDDDEGYTKATEYSTLAYEILLEKDGPVDERVLKAGHMLVESLVDVTGDFVQAEHYCRSMYLAIVDSDSLDFDQNVSQDYLLAATAGNQLASLCWRSAHAYAVYALHNPDNDEEEEPSPVVDPIEAEAFCRQTMDLIQTQFDEDSAPVAQHALECLGTLRRVLILQYNDWIHRLSILKNNHNPQTKPTIPSEFQSNDASVVGNNKEEEEEEEESIEVQMERMEEKIYVLREEIIELKGQIEGIAEVCAPQELLYWTKDLEGCSFGSPTDNTLNVEDMVDEKEEDDPDLTWTSAISTKG